MRNLRALALAAVVGLLLAACGARLPAAERQQAAEAVLNAGGGGASGANPSGTANGANPNGNGNSANGNSANGLIGPGGQPLPGSSTAPGTGGGGSGGNGSGSRSGTGQQQTAPTGCARNGTDVGLTGNSITIGTVASETGPVSGLFEGAIQGIEAFRAYVNSQGGICGHTVNVVTADDGTTCSGNQNATQDLAGRVFAFVGSFSLFDGCGASYINQHHIPDLHVQLDPAAGTGSSHFDMEPGPLGYATGMFAYYRQKYGSKVQNVGTLYPNIPSAVDKQMAFEHSAQSEGWKFIYTRAADATETDWTQDFVKMCHGNPAVQIFFTPAENAANAAKMINDESSAGCSGLINIIPIAYDQAFPPDVGNNSEIEGLQGWNEYSLFFNANEAANIPELGTLQTWFQRTNPGKALNLYALFAWTEGLMLQQAIQNGGSTLTRGTLIASLGKIHQFSGDGIMAPVDPGTHSTGVQCYILWQFHSGHFERIDDPTAGYRCDGRWLALH